MQCPGQWPGMVPRVQLKMSLSAARAAWLNSNWVVTLNQHHMWAGLQMGGVLHQDQWIKKAPVGASELVIAYIILLHGHFNI